MKRENYVIIIFVSIFCFPVTDFRKGSRTDLVFDLFSRLFWCCTVVYIFCALKPDLPKDTGITGHRTMSRLLVVNVHMSLWRHVLLSRVTDNVIKGWCPPHAFTIFVLCGAWQKWATLGVQPWYHMGGRGYHSECKHNAACKQLIGSAYVLSVCSFSVWIYVRSFHVSSSASRNWNNDKMTQLNMF